jgi:hypothetical protein
METVNQKLSKIFADSYYRIPDYQRGYAWSDDKQLPELWEDLLDITRNKNDDGFHPHFTGTLSLRRVPNSELKSDAEKVALQSGHDFFDVVDGQQRLTTLVILLFVLGKYLKASIRKEIDAKYIKTKIKGRSVLYKLSYGGNNINNDYYLRKEIFEDSDTLPCRNNVYTNNLRRAKAFFTEKIEGLKQKERTDLYEKLVTALVFDIKFIDDSLDVQAVFETMNNRGKPLTTLEKLKNRLLYLTDKMSGIDKEELAGIVNQGWGSIYENLGKNPDVLLDEDDFLSAHLTLLRVPRDYAFSEQLAEKKVFEMFCSRASTYQLSYARNASEDDKEEVVSYNKIRNYVIDVSNYVPFWYDVNMPNFDTPQGVQLAKILYLDRSKEIRLFLAELMRLRKTNEGIVDGILKCVEKILFRNSLPCPSLMDVRTLATRARELHSKDLSLEDLKATLDSTLAYPVSAESLATGFRGLFDYSRSNIGFHRWVGLRFFLFEYEEYIHQKENKRDFEKIKWQQFDETSVEHIMPKKWWDHWTAEMDAYLALITPPEEPEGLAHKIIINTLGNLTILKDSKNSSLGNNPWNVKREAYSTGCYSEMAISKHTDWNYYTILERGKDMLDYLGTLLGIKFIKDQNQDDYASILFYSKSFTKCDEESGL